MKLHGATLALPGEPVGEVLQSDSRRRPSFFKFYTPIIGLILCFFVASATILRGQAPPTTGSPQGPSKPTAITDPLGRGEIALLSDDPRGVVAYALPPGELRAGVVVSVPTWVRSKLQKILFRPLWSIRHDLPLRRIIAILLNGVLVYLLRPPLFYRIYHFRFLATLLVGYFPWLARRIMERGFERALNGSRAQGRGAEPILIQAQRFTHA